MERATRRVLVEMTDTLSPNLFDAQS